ncbi:MAG: ethanolamine ammonia-lyase subunit EutC [Tepidimonas sp.]|nr:ethanolamine ammonia-lyase subunit EutC [Tepidimonas sp.]
MSNLPSAPEAATTAVTWAELQRWTPARIGLPRTGSSLTTRDVLAFAAAHAQARDAVHTPLDVSALCAEIERDGWPAPLVVRSRARHRSEYLLRPDLGRRLDEDSGAELQRWRQQHAPADLALVVGDGLSALGVQRHAAGLLRAIRAALGSAWSLMPPVIAVQARVALGDEIGERLGARMVVVLIGERPGLSSPDSIGVYLTMSPRVGCTDAQRNCISNVRPGGQDLHTAAQRLAWLVAAAWRLGRTGVDLKDHSGLPMVGSATGVTAADPLIPAPPHQEVR